ncbi:MAG: alpha/beta hydrolase [Clostridia bacterium]|nr:alpha/beta hydrolase [Clostridia bacterium]
MSLSLELKKFINSEHVGGYVEITLPTDPELEESLKKRRGEPSLRGGERVKVHYMEEGNGEPLILVHTIGQSLYTWRNVFENLSKYYRVIAVDLLGHGYSDRPYSTNYTITEQADMLRLFMDAMGIESSHFMAFSMGSAYVMQLASTNPERIGRIILISPGGVTNEMPLTIRLIDNPILGIFACRMFGVKTVENVLSDAFFDLTNITPELVKEYYSTISDPDARLALRLSLTGYDDEMLIKKFRTMNAEVLILLGGEDKWRQRESVEVYHAALKNASVSIIRNAGHMIQEEKADRVVAATLEYIPVIMPDAE